MRIIRRGVLLLGTVALSLAAGCHTWQPVDVPRAPAPVQRLRSPTRVELRDGRVYELVNVVVATDSLFGTSNDEARVRGAFLLAQVKSLEELRDDTRRTLGLILLLAIVGAGAGVTGF